MVANKRALVLATCFLSGTASILSLISLGTTGWIYSDIKLGSVESKPNSHINYGLFKGTFSQTVGVTANIDISMACSYGNNICAALCSGDSDRRSAILEQLHDNGETDWRMSECVRTTSQSYLMRKSTEFYFNFLKLNAKSGELIFINAFAYLFTIIFLILSAVIGLISSGLSVWNTASNPIEIYFNIFGLYLYNGIAFGFLLISVLIWGIVYFTSLIESSASIVVLSGLGTTVNVSLGWSYWINFGSLILYATSIAVLYFRSYQISKEPTQHKIEMDGNAPAEILLF
ncbi:hypothetical protein WA026_012057 [Henosepilachna vigintioctopunctata]|uniref:Clarin-3 n=1 Tax=Henosepilachna vigintioctopunctata TaxID=420089 RepID=A0AAW1V6H6_9CUCU